MPRSAWLLALALTGCLNIKILGTGADKPSNVAMYFQVDTRAGNPVAGLEAENFEIYEDGRRVSNFESRQTILNPRLGAVHYTMLLLDLSGSVTRAGQIPTLVKAASAFIDRIAEYQLVALYAFDGRAEIQQISPFSNNPKELKAELERLKSWRVIDPSTNLHGAVVDAVEELESYRDKATAPLSFGTLVVFTDGTDQAKRVSKDELTEKLKQTNLEIFVVGLGAEIDRRVLDKIGRDGFFKADNEAALTAAFDQVGQRIETLSKRYYLLSYCSPSRDGAHELKVKVKAGRSRATIQYTFDARDFTPNCDPNKVPQLSPPEEKRRWWERRKEEEAAETAAAGS